MARQLRRKNTRRYTMTSGPSAGRGRRHRRQLRDELVLGHYGQIRSVSSCPVNVMNDLSPIEFGGAILLCVLVIREAFRGIQAVLARRNGKGQVNGQVSPVAIDEMKKLLMAHTEKLITIVEGQRHMREDIVETQRHVREDVLQIRDHMSETRAMFNLYESRITRLEARDEVRGGDNPSDRKSGASHA